MKIHQYGKICRWADLKPGDLFSVSFDDKMFFAMKLRGEEEGDEYFSCAVITPGLQGYEKVPGIVLDNVVKDRILYAFPDAVLVPSSDPSQYHFSDDGKRAEVGDLIHTPEGLILMVANAKHPPLAFTLADGNILHQGSLTKYVVISAWEVSVPKLDDHKMLFEWPIK